MSVAGSLERAEKIQLKIGGMACSFCVASVTKVGAESFLSQVARQVEEARALKPGLLALVDRILQIYVPAVLLFAAAAVFIWTAGAWGVTGAADWTRAIFAALAVLVMGYPCSLGMATPLAMIRGGGMAAERGILMRSAEARTSRSSRPTWYWWDTAWPRLPTPSRSAKRRTARRSKI